MIWVFGEIDKEEFIGSRELILSRMLKTFFGSL